MDTGYVLTFFVCLLVIASVIAFILYGRDKIRAEKKRPRVKEKHLLASAAFGGALGAFLGRLVFRHKTEKGYFSAVIYVSLLLQAGVLAFLVLRYTGVIA